MYVLTLLEMSVISGQQVVWRRAPLTTLGGDSIEKILA